LIIERGTSMPLPWAAFLATSVYNWMSALYPDTSFPMRRFCAIPVSFNCSAPSIASFAKSAIT
jgi:hypothetical protein